MVSRVACGLWRLADDRPGRERVVERIETCLELGITTFDHADIYGDYACETLFGDALAAMPAATRDGIELVSKCGIKPRSAKHPERLLDHYDTGRRHIVEAAERSLRNLRTDHLDLLLIHRPDPLMDADEVAAAFSELRQAGKVLHCGVSNFLPAQFDLLASRLEAPLVTNQVEMSVLCLDAWTDGVVDHCQRLHLAPMAWSPLAGGRLFGGADERAARVLGTLCDIGEELRAGPDQVALAWLLSHPAGIVPVVGSGRLERLRAAAAATALELDRQQWFRVWTASTGVDVP